ncbi:MAG: hypothetical protein COB42_05300 [Sulfurimonas sp.]|nr:MAG: hypothetical protein COB42_05300 [Sulfurimonas sp.]
MADSDYEASYNIGVFYQQLEDYKLAEFWYKKSWNISQNKDSAFNLGQIYKRNNNINKAIQWYKKASQLGDNSGAFLLGVIYENNFKKYNEAIKWYKKSYNHFKDKDAANNLGLLYKNQKDYKKSEVWYKKAVERESLDALKNLGRLYHYKLQDDVQAVTYFIALINNKYPKKRILSYMREDWKLPCSTIQKGYQAQLNSKIIPEKLKYKGGI